jgi:hypothetical protein
MVAAAGVDPVGGVAVEEVVAEGDPLHAASTAAARVKPTSPVTVRVPTSSG